MVDAQDMMAVYQHFVDPRDVERFKDPEQWAEADTLGHTGRRYRTAEQLYAAALNAEPHADAERRDELRLDAAKAEQHNVAFLDATFSVPKSWSVLHTAFEFEEANARRVGDLEAAEAWGAHRQAVEDAVWAGNNAMLDYMSAKAGYSRVGHHGGGEGRFIDAHDWTIASFFQHDSRDHDPHLHIHNTVLNRVQGSDGVWRTLDSDSLRVWRPAGAAVGERTASEHLTRSMSARVAMRPDGKAREILGIATELLDLSSSRSRAIAPKVAELAAAYEQVNGRAPKGMALARLTREASEKTRPGKTSTGQTREEFVRGVDREFLTKTGAGMAQVAADVVARAGEPVEAPEWSETAVLETAIEAVQLKQSGWTEPYLSQDINNELPDYLGGLEGWQVAALIDGLTTKALPMVVSLKTPKPGEGVTPSELRLENGKPADERPHRALRHPGAHPHRTAPARRHRTHRCPRAQRRPRAGVPGRPRRGGHRVGPGPGRRGAGGVDVRECGRIAGRPGRHR